MRAALDDPPAVEYEDLIGIDDGREAVGDHECRAAGGYAAECALHEGWEEEEVRWRWQWWRWRRSPRSSLLGFAV